MEKRLLAIEDEILKADSPEEFTEIVDVDRRNEIVS